MAADTRTVMADDISTGFIEFATVSLVRPVEVAGKVLPAGSRGTVVAAYADKAGYEVEFEAPFHAVVTLNGDALAA